MNPTRVLTHVLLRRCDRHGIRRLCRRVDRRHGAACRLRNSRLSSTRCSCGRLCHCGALGFLSYNRTVRAALRRRSRVGVASVGFGTSADDGVEAAEQCRHLYGAGDCSVNVARLGPQASTAAGTIATAIAVAITAFAHRGTSKCGNNTHYTSPHC